MHALIAPSGGRGQPRPPQENVLTKRKRKIKRKKTSPNPTQPNPGRQKAFDEKGGQLTAAKKIKESTCRPRATEETDKPWKILEITLAKET